MNNSPKGNEVLLLSLSPRRRPPLRLWRETRLGLGVGRRLPGDSLTRHRGRNGWCTHRASEWAARGAQWDRRLPLTPPTVPFLFSFLAPLLQACAFPSASLAWLFGLLAELGERDTGKRRGARALPCRGVGGVRKGPSSAAVARVIPS